MSGGGADPLVQLLCQIKVRNRVWILRRTATLLNHLSREDDGKASRRLSIRADELVNVQ